MKKSCLGLGLDNNVLFTSLVHTERHSDVNFITLLAVKSVRVDFANYLH